MATLQEIYQMALKLGGPDNAAAQAIKKQIEAEAYSKGQSAERFFIAGGIGKQMQAIKKGKPA